MINILLIFIFITIGYLLQFVKSLPTNLYKTLNKIVINFCLPALTLYYIPKIDGGRELLYPIGAAWLCFLLSALFFNLLGKRFGWSKKLIGCLILTAGLSNTSFLGFPIMKALYGDEGLKMAILVDQPGTFVVVSTIAVFVAAFYAKGNSDGFVILKKILSFPPFIAFVVAILLNVCKYDFNDTVQNILITVGGFVTSIALLSVGLQLKFDKKSKHWRFLALGLLFKLLIMPLFILVLYVFVFKQRGMVINVTILEMAMAPMITAAILASSYGLKPKLSSMMIGFGIPISFLTLTIWYFILEYIL